MVKKRKRKDRRKLGTNKSSRRERTSNHHTKPTSQGGQDNYEHPGNEIEIPHNRLHGPFHTIFGNWRPNHIIRLLITEWDTTCPHVVRKAPHIDVDRMKTRIDAWDTLFEEDGHHRLRAVECIIDVFVSTREDKELVKETLESCRASKHLSRTAFKNLVVLLN